MAKINLPIIYSQNDPRWADNTIGNSTLKFSRYACLICCEAMCAKYYGFDENPATINEKLTAKGGFTADGRYYWTTITKLFSKITEKVTDTPLPLSDDQMALIKNNIDAGQPVICQIDYNPKDVDPDMHFVVFVGYNPADEDDFTILDPIDGKEKSLKSYMGWFKPNARKAIDRIVVMNGPKPQVAPSQIIVDKKEYDGFMYQIEQWIKLVGYILGPESDPKHTTYEDCQRVIAGIKSTQTDLKTRLDAALSDLAIANTEVINQKDKVANTESECQRSLKTQKAEYEGKIAAMPNVSKLEGQYKGTIDDLEGKLRESQKQGGLKDLEITKLTQQIENSQRQITATTTAVKSVLKIISSLFTRLTNHGKSN